MVQKVVLVTGASIGGFGNAICRAFAAAGCKVYASARSQDSMQLAQYGCTELELDVTDSNSISRVVERIIEESGRIDIVVNNAGALLKGWAVECPLQCVRQLMEVNFFAVLAMNSAAAPAMIKQRSGTLINIGSATGYTAVAQASAYSASKHAIRAYSDALRVELAPFNVKVMHVAPGFMKTQIFSKQAVVSGGGANSPYSQFAWATKELHQNDVQEGMGSWAPTDPALIAGRLVKHALRRHPPRHYVDGWMSWPMFVLGCFAPCWLLDLLQVLRLRLYPIAQ